MKNSLRQFFLLGLICPFLFSCSSNTKIELNKDKLILKPQDSFKFEINNIKGEVNLSCTIDGIVEIDNQNVSVTALKEGRTTFIASENTNNTAKCEIVVRHDHIEPTNAINIATIAHKGYHVDEIENTLGAFSAAGRRNFYGIETDIYLTKDKYWVCNHDPKIKGMTKNISDSTLDEILEVNLSNDPNKIVRICRFEDYINVCSAYNKHPVIEFKEDENITYLEQLISLLKNYNVINECIFISKISSVLGNMYNLREKYHYSYDLQMLTEGTGWQYVPEILNVSSQYDGINAAMIEDCKFVGQYVAAWTVNEKEVAENLITLGVKYITTDIFECSDQFVDNNLFGI